MELQIKDLFVEKLFFKMYNEDSTLKDYEKEVDTLKSTMEMVEDVPESGLSKEKKEKLEHNQEKRREINKEKTPHGYTVEQAEHFQVLPKKLLKLSVDHYMSLISYRNSGESRADCCYWAS